MHNPPDDEEADGFRGVALWRAIVGGLTAIILLGLGVIVSQQINMAQNIRDLSEREATASAKMQGEIDVLMANIEAAKRQVMINTPRIDKMERDLVAIEQRLEYIRTYQLRSHP